MLMPVAAILVSTCCVFPAIQDEKSDAAPKKPPRPFRIAHPQKDWAVEIEIPGFILSDFVKTRQDGKAATMQASDPSRGMIISMFVFDAVKDGDEKVCRDYHWDRLQKAPLKFSDVKMTERDGMALNWRNAEVPGTKVQQRNVNGYLVHEGVWIDIHLSKIPAKDGDDDKLDAILKTVRYKEGIDPKLVNRPPSFVLLREGAVAFRKNDYKAAITAYEKSLDLEKKDRTLDDRYWRSLIDELGMSYGLSGDLDKAKSVLEYGIQEDPTYPLFHYNLAVAFAEMNDLDSAIASLRSALKYKSNLSPGEKMSDPRTSFKKYFADDDERFKKLIDNLEL